MAKNLDQYIAVIDTKIAGIPAKLGVLEVYQQSPLGYWCDSDHDARGYTDVSFDVLDRKGYIARWLDSKIDDNMLSILINEIIDSMTIDID